MNRGTYYSFWQGPGYSFWRGPGDIRRTGLVPIVRASLEQCLNSADTLGAA